MPGNFSQQAKKQGGRKIKIKPPMLKRYIDERGNVIERMAYERGSASSAGDYHVAKAAQAIADFDQAWAHASAPSNQS
ncbi:hypothetical protein PG996_009894 [Apiospora saccharicola]|uniref:Uncharacterized protein n=1 Tax=Apiospora saccharicola TaxID=335842 RepID=A0ABR1UM26_9PEZI